VTRAIVVVQARFGSSRLPGKVLADLAGQPLLARVLARARAIPGADIVVLATTTGRGDDAVADLGAALGVDVFRGSEDDVLDRYYQAARRFEGDPVVRVTADCPFLDPAVSGLVLAEFRRGGADYVSNFEPRRYPDGLDTEVFSFAALERAWREARLPSEREHVTPYIWKHPERFRLRAVAPDEDHSDLRWTVDEPRDLEFARAVYARLGQAGPSFGMAEVLALLAREPELSGINAGFVTNEGYARSLARDPSRT
jgi:spore coat polysaccharide biosynthesis protein SpsF